MSKSFYKKTDYLQKVAVRIINWGLKSPEKYNVGLLISNAEFQDLMKISRTTSYRWRSKKIIASSQNYKKLYFNMTDIMQMLLDNYSEIHCDQVCRFRDLIPSYRINHNNGTIEVIKSIKK